MTFVTIWLLRRPLRSRPHPQAEGHVLEDRHVAEQGVVLEDEAHLPAADVVAGHVLIVEQDRPAAGVGLFQAGDDPQQRRLSRARTARAGPPVRRWRTVTLTSFRAANVPKVLLMFLTSMLMIDCLSLA